MSKNFKHLVPLALLVFALSQSTESFSLAKDDEEASTHDQIPVDGIHVSHSDKENHSRTKRSGSYQIGYPAKYANLYGNLSPFVVLGVSPSLIVYSFVYKESTIPNRIDSNQAQNPAKPQYPGGAQQPQYPGGTQQPQYPGGAQQPQYPGGTQGPQTPPRFDTTRFDGVDEDKITFMENEDNDKNLPIRPGMPYPKQPPSAAYPSAPSSGTYPSAPSSGAYPSAPSGNTPSQNLPADDYQGKYFNTLTGISLEKIPPPRPDSRTPPPIAHGSNQSSFRGKREVVEVPVSVPDV